MKIFFFFASEFSQFPRVCSKFFALSGAESGWFPSSPFRSLPSARSLGSLWFRRTWFSSHSGNGKSFILRRHCSSCAVGCFVGSRKYFNAKQYCGYDWTPTTCNLTSSCIHNRALSLALALFTLFFLSESGSVYIRYWQLFAVVCNIAAPSSEIIRNYLRSHLRRSTMDSSSEECRYATYCQKVIRCEWCGGSVFRLLNYMTNIEC